MSSVLFWDFHGTLIYPDSLWSPQYLKTIRRYFPQCTVTEAEIRAAFPAGSYPWDHPEQDYTSLNTPELWWRHMEEAFHTMYLRCGFTENEARFLSKNTREQLICPELFRFYPDVRPQLKKFQNMGFQNAILSNNFPELEQVISAQGYSDLFDCCISSACNGFEKPRRELFEFARYRTGYPQECWMIGDNLSADIEGGNNAGFHTVLLRGKKSSLADVCCNDLYELETYFTQHAIKKHRG